MVSYSAAPKLILHFPSTRLQRHQISIKTNNKENSCDHVSSQNQSKTTMDLNHITICRLWSLFVLLGTNSSTQHNITNTLIFFSLFIHQVNLFLEMIQKLCLMDWSWSNNAYHVTNIISVTKVNKDFKHLTDIITYPSCLSSMTLTVSRVFSSRLTKFRYDSITMAWYDNGNSKSVHC